MSRLTHRICDPCWEKREPGRRPIRFGLELVGAEPCCFCGADFNGIYVRELPENAPHCTKDHQT